MTAKSRTVWTFAVTSAALFMASLDNLVVTTALPSIRAQHAPNAVGNFCFEVTLGYRRVERGR